MQDELANIERQGCADRVGQQADTAVQIVEGVLRDSSVLDEILDALAYLLVVHDFVNLTNFLMNASSTRPTSLTCS